MKKKENISLWIVCNEDTNRFSFLESQFMVPSWIVGPYTSNCLFLTCYLWNYWTEDLAYSIMVFCSRSSVVNYSNTLLRLRNIMCTLSYVIAQCYCVNRLTLVLLTINYVLIEQKTATICKQYARHRLYTNINFNKNASQTHRYYSVILHNTTLIYVYGVYVSDYYW